MKPVAALLCLLALVPVTGCRLLPPAAPPTSLHGFAFLPGASAPLGSDRARRALLRLRATGANSLCLVVFLRQDGPRAVALRPPRSGARQILATLRAARALGLHTVLKPQVLPRTGWAGVIAPRDRGRWFRHYRAQLVRLARLAEAAGADAFVVGTELRRLADAPEWGGLITALRRHFHGRLTYAAHGLEGLAAFRWWHRLDVVSLTLYPPLPADPDPERLRQVLVHRLHVARALAPADKPLWVLEAGIPSARGWERRPWDWSGLRAAGVVPDPALQARVLEAWVRAQRATALDGLWLWAWYSDPEAGGCRDTGYAIQGKPAVDRLRCHWRGDCREEIRCT
ncbi:MAG: glycosidase-like protein [Gammaproteobacteria bacterium]|nr:MAG: glycosidase-like protein [Gammaproteobacteria bacterium]